MRFHRSRANLDRFGTAELTYAEHGATQSTLPQGYHQVHRHEQLGAGPETFLRAVTALTTWEMHRAVGLTVDASTPTAVVGSVVVMRLGPPGLDITIPCRVVYVVDEPDRQGFAYGTLPGHPETGEEAFVVHMHVDGGVYLDLRAFSRPATLMARAGGPFTRLMQQLVTDRYVRALRRLSRR
jgi:uncharacterized protein (UPF0548 family)